MFLPPFFDFDFYGIDSIKNEVIGNKVAYEKPNDR
jgi:hypothetical protein